MDDERTIMGKVTKESKVNGFEASYALAMLGTTMLGCCTCVAHIKGVILTLTL